MPRIPLCLVCSVYNASETVSLFLASILNQSYTYWVLYLVDDCSSDETLSIINAFPDNRIKLICNPSNLGLTRSLIRAIEYLPTDAFILRLDVDELHCSDYLFNIASLFSRGHDLILVTPKSYVVHISRILHKTSPRLLVLFLSLWGNCYSHGSSSYISSLYHSAHGYNKIFYLSQDFDLWMRLLPKASNPYFTASDKYISSQISRSTPSLSSSKPSFQFFFSLMALHNIFKRPDRLSFTRKVFFFAFFFPIALSIRLVRSVFF